jgi:transcriptional regulator of acetoin/glycerol metabolism
MNEKLDRLIEEMVQRGVRFPEATREFGLHRNTLSRKIAEHRIKRRP